MENHSDKLVVLLDMSCKSSPVNLAVSLERGGSSHIVELFCGLYGGHNSSLIFRFILTSIIFVGVLVTHGYG